VESTQPKEVLPLPTRPLAEENSTVFCGAASAPGSGFIGIEDAQTVRAEGMNMPLLAIYAVLNGERAVEALVL
jgi:hypothetical protein